MASNGKGNPPAPLQPQVVSKLLDLLSTDDDFRELFQTDARAALAQAGYMEPAGSGLASALAGGSLTSAASCLQLQGGASLASKESIMQERSKLEQSLNAVQHFDCPAELQAN